MSDYRDGYEDGLAGLDPERPWNAEYMDGYRAGEEAP